MILPIYAYGFPVLKKVADDITPDYPKLKELLENMWDTMYDAHGIGLAAPQIGHGIRLLSLILPNLKRKIRPITWVLKKYLSMLKKWKNRVVVGVTKKVV